MGFGRVKYTKYCVVSGCGVRVKAMALCTNHYAYWMRTGRLTKPARIVAACAALGCGRVSVRRGYCSGHYQRFLRYGDPLAGNRARGTGHITPQGYVKVLRTGKLVGQHRVVMEQSLGRRLYPHETVHHRNGQRADNRVENLELWSGDHPSGQRVEDKIAWAVQFLSLYGIEVIGESRFAP